MLKGMKDEKESKVPIMDLYHAAFLSLHGCTPELSAHNNRVTFLFPVGETFNELSRLYSENSMIPVVSFIQEIRKLRSKMLSFKEYFEYSPRCPR